MELGRDCKVSNLDLGRKLQMEFLSVYYKVKVLK